MSTLTYKPRYSVFAGVLLAISSAPSSAVVFNSYTEYEISGYSDDISTVEEYEFYVLDGDAAIPVSVGASDEVSTGDVLNPSAFARADALATIGADHVSDISTLTGAVSSESHAYAFSNRLQSADAYSIAAINVNFSLDIEHDFLFSRNVLELTDFAEFNYELYSLDTDEYVFSDANDAPSSSGTLLAGNYSLFIEAYTEVNGLAGESLAQSSGQFSLVLTELPDVGVVPLPASVWLFASGLLGLVAISRRKSSI